MFLRQSVVTVVLVAVLAAAHPSAAQEWVTFANETSLRLPTGPGLNDAALSTTDPEEKDYAWGDVDQDGDIDLVVVRKQPFTSSGRRRNVLFMNEGTLQGHAMNGVLVDRSTQFIPGFLDETNDRDVALVDVDGDGWLDIVTAPTYGQGLPTTISHPRVYINLRDEGAGWQGFEYQPERMPVFPSHPNFCGIGVGDVTGDGAVDLYFTDYDNIAGNSFDDRLLINDGQGFFSDQSSLRMTSSMINSGFGINAVIADVNGDGWNDVLKNEAGPVETFLNAGEGFFDVMETTYIGAAYFFNVGILDEPAPFTDATLDIVISDDGVDRFLLNQGNGIDGFPNYSVSTMPNSTGGFGSNSVIADLNNDGWNDVIIADVDVDASGCARITDILRSNGDPDNLAFVADTGGIPENLLNGVHDAAVFDLNNDGWLDVVFGRCTGTQVWMNAPPIGVEFDYPQGLPEVVPPQADAVVEVQLQPIGDVVVADSVTLHVSVNGGEFVSGTMQELAENVFSGSLPASACQDHLDFYISAQLSGGLTFFDPPDAPGTTYLAIAAEGLQVLFADDFEADVSSWTVTSTPSLTSGAWEQADPNSTIHNNELAAPEDDATPGDGNVMAFVTENGPPGASAFQNDVDGGPTYLLSPLFDLGASDAVVSYSRWFYSASGTPDRLTTEVSTDGGESWNFVEAVGTTDGEWEAVSFLVSDFAEPSSTVQLRFWTSDPDVSVTEGGIDDVVVERFVCALGCVSDLDGNGAVGSSDLALLLGAWGPNPGHAADLDGNGAVGSADLALLLGDWGPCL